jgi:hypothetical protein
LGAGLTIQPCKKVIVTKPQKRGGKGPNWAVEPFDDDDDDDNENNIVYSVCPFYKMFVSS